MSWILRVSLVLFAACLSVLPGVCSAAPRIEIAEPVHDAGEVLEGTEISHEFLLKNVGDEILSLKVKPC
ncbi:MAG: hypothetical protein ACP5G0_10315 [Desulfomonilia bacterium]